MAGLIHELKRRKVFRVLVAYVVAAWLLLQVADVLSSILALPPWAPKLVFYLLAIGLAPAMILAWAYELTPDGIKRDAGMRKTGFRVNCREIEPAGPGNEWHTESWKPRESATNR